MKTLFDTVRNRQDVKEVRVWCDTEFRASIEYIDEPQPVYGSGKTEDAAINDAQYARVLYLLETN